MELTEKKGEVVLDCRGVEDSYESAENSQRRYFMRETLCGWEETAPQLYKMAYTVTDYESEYEKYSYLKRLINNCQARALYLPFIKITHEFYKLMYKVCERVEELYEQEQAEKAKREAEKKWKNVCKFGCGDCKNLCYAIDMPVCGLTGESLEERNEPVYKGGVLRLFNLVPLPTDKCPYAASRGEI